MSSDQAEGFSIFGRKITRSLVLVAVVMVLAALNLHSWSLSAWYSEQFIDNVALTQNAFENLFHEFDELLKEDTLREDKLLGLKVWVEETSILSAKVTFLDRSHFDLWERISDNLELFEKLLEDLRVVVRIQSESNDPIPLNNETCMRLQVIYDNLKESYDYIFPTDVLEEGTPWERQNYDRMENAFRKLNRFSKTVAKAWLIIPTIINSSAVSPEMQARSFLVEAVGEEYFEKYLELWHVEYNDWEPDEWLTGVIYFYYIQVGDYNATREINFQFDKTNKMIRIMGVPKIGNLMPYYITSTQAIEVSTPEVSRDFVEVYAEIYYVEKMYDGPFFDSYLWCIEFFHVPRNSRGGSVTRVYIDPHIGDVLGVEEYRWATDS